ncbi:hypothetical protein Taro_018809 [Colocasia esculenta]|uniref:Uncharacterized protein n=1 Tax=Colocasia esculenta TaxID=4460 RepID=A0A843UUY8_COLES|nr:hypothetical protein [Colocasia esculenta]
MATAKVVPVPIATFSRVRRGPSLRTTCSLSCLLTLDGGPLPGRRDMARGICRVRARGRAPLFSPHTPRAAQSRVEEGEESGRRAEEEDEGQPFSVLTSIRSPYNEIIVVDTPTSRVLLLDSTHNVHSILNKGQILTNSYWDEFATLPAIIPNGPIAILGLGGGTAAHVILDLWPKLHLIGWEIDGILIDKARKYFQLSDLEKHNHAGGFLSINVGDALSASVSVPGGFAGNMQIEIIYRKKLALNGTLFIYLFFDHPGIIVDLFYDGKVLPQLQEVDTWLELEKKLMPHGRIMVNCGGAHAETSNRSGLADPEVTKDDTWVQNSTIKALCVTFDGKLSWKRMAEQDSENYMALTGPIPEIESWSSSVPSQLASNVKSWKPCGLA